MNDVYMVPELARIMCIRLISQSVMPCHACHNFFSFFEDHRLIKRPPIFFHREEKKGRTPGYPEKNIM